jgi:hypothetical protein
MSIGKKKWQLPVPSQPGKDVPVVVGTLSARSGRLCDLTFHFAGTRGGFPPHELAHSAYKVRNPLVEGDAIQAVLLASGVVAPQPLAMLLHKLFVAMPGFILLADEDLVVRHQFDVACLKALQLLFHAVKPRFPVAVGFAHFISFRLGGGTGAAGGGSSAFSRTVALTVPA